MGAATQRLQEELEEQKAAGGELGSSAVSCEVCGEDAIAVSERNTPRDGGLALDGYEAHVDDGDTYYHRK